MRPLQLRSHQRPTPELRPVGHWGSDEFLPLFGSEATTFLLKKDTRRVRNSREVKNNSTFAPLFSGDRLSPAPSRQTSRSQQTAAGKCWERSDRAIGACAEESRSKTFRDVTKPQKKEEAVGRGSREKGGRGSEKFAEDAFLRICGDVLVRAMKGSDNKLTAHQHV